MGIAAIWRGTAKGVVEEWRATPVNVEIGDVFVLSINSQSISFTATVATVVNVTAGLKTVWNATAHPNAAPAEHQEITATDKTAYLELLHDTAGVPFEVYGAVTTGGANESQRVQIITGTPTTGNFTLSYAGQTTGNIAWNASAATVDAALEALSNIDAGDVTCTGGPLPGTPIDVEFTGLLAATNVVAMTAADVSLDDGAVPIVTAITITQAAAATGPYHASNATNWSVGVVPVGGTHSLIFEDSSRSMLYDIDTLSGTFDSAIFRASYRGYIGLPPINANGYAEYRRQYFAADLASIDIGEGEGSGSSRIKIDTGATVTAIRVWSTSTTAADAGVPMLLWKGTHVSNTMSVNKGNVGIGFFGGETAKLLTLDIGHDGVKASDAFVIFQPTDGTLPTVTQKGGTFVTHTTMTTFTQTGGVSELMSAVAVTTLNVWGNRTVGDLTESDLTTCYIKTSGTITTLNVGGALVSCERDARAHSIATTNAHAGTWIRDIAGTNSWVIVTHHTNMTGLTLETPFARKWTQDDT